MIAMQYSFPLPADYDMGIIERRIREKGHMLDGFAKLRFKAYLQARRGEGSRENLYAPFYVWGHPEGLSNFLCGPGFVGLTENFGWPQVSTWVVWRAETAPAISSARYATRTIVPIEAHADLAGLRDQAEAAARQARADGALAAVAGFDPTAWNTVAFRLWAEKPALVADAQLYAVGHISEGAEAA